jgi:hypothetical protein
MPRDIRLVWKRLTVANTCGYYDTATITIVKHFILHFGLKSMPREKKALGQYFKLFKVIIIAILQKS